jgi:glutamine---fructose-6-phosphate transaminase (isomerizing)
VFVSDGKQGELNQSLANDILQLGGRVLLVGSTAGLPENGASGLAFPIHSVPDFLRPVLEVVPVQVLAFELAAAQGYEPGTVRYISKIILSEEGIPNQL